MEILVKASQLVLSISILVIFHEFGHYFFARLFKTRVEKFYLFFDPWFSLFKIKRGDTEYGIGWLPLGGYVKISGMIDESMDKEQMKLPPQPYEFRSKKAWQRLLIMIGGVLVNIILAVLIYTSILFVWGETYLPAKNVKYGISVDSLGMALGLQNGDKIIKVNGKEEENFSKIVPNLLLNSPKTLTVERDSQIVEITVDERYIAAIIAHQAPFFEPRIPFYVSDFGKESAGKEAGLQVNDQIIGINDEKILYFSEFRASIITHKNETVKVNYTRNGVDTSVMVKVPESGLLGIYPNAKMSDFFELEKKQYSFFQAIPAGIAKGYNEIKSYLKQLKLIFTPETGAYKSVGSFISIAKIFPSTWNWEAFWSFTALLSIMLAVINILPIPALDGGHVMFLLYEIIVGKKPSDKFLEVAQIVGMVLLLSLMVLALGNDFIRHVF